MNDFSHKPPERCNVAVVGGGPAGLAAATELARLRVADVVVLEREPQAGGIPTHCGHRAFGMREFRRCYDGPRYAECLVAHAQRAGVSLHTNTTVVSAGEGGQLTLATVDGVSRLVANKVILSTGARETPRSARLVSGQHPLGIVTTGALQSMVYLKKKIPFKRPVIIGTELVSLSALLTCRHANIAPVAMLEQSDRLTARSGLGLLPKLLGVPLCFETRVDEIMGAQRVTGVRIKNAGGATSHLKCDGVLFTGRFTPESTLLGMGHLAVDAYSGGPVVDQFGGCSDPAYFAAGNLLRPVETAGWCWKEGVHMAHCVHLSLAGRLREAGRRVPITFAGPTIKYIVPQTFSAPMDDAPAVGMKHLQLRFLQPAKGRLALRADSTEIQAKSVHALPERRILLRLTKRLNSSRPTKLSIEFDHA